jgi:lipopolysaccharide transport system ATP-binding protein
MSKEIVIRAVGLGKKYQLGTIGYGSLRHDLQAWWAKFRGREDPSAQIGGKSRLDLHGDFWALRRISFEVAHGDRVGIIGRNGAGKSTLLKILSQITRPTEGSVKMKGQVASLLEVGTGFHPELTGRENVFLNGAIMGMKRREIEKKFDEIVEFSGVEQFIDTPVKRYSSGMYVRLGFAVAAHLDPDILVVDEVLAVGDASFQKKCLGKMEDVSRQGRTVLFVSHNLQSTLRLCNRGILLQDGQIVATGEMKSVVDVYMDSKASAGGEVCWSTPESAPGDSRVRLKAVRVVSKSGIPGRVSCDEDFRVEMDYWNFEEAKRYASVHVVNSMGATVFISSNLPSMSRKVDEWYSRNIPKGVFRTACTIPGNLLNSGSYSLSIGVAENRLPVQQQEDVSFWKAEVLTFEVSEPTTVRDFSAEWIGVVRVRLDWETIPLGAAELVDRKEK